MTDHDHAHGDNPHPRAFWNSQYAESDQRWSGDVNPGLITIASDLTPGRALDVGCGEGGDAIWLARRGWHVSGVDISSIALARAKLRAEREGIPGGRIQWFEADLATWHPESEYDLISAFFLQSQIEFPRETVLRALRDALAPRGLLTIVSHAAPPPGASESHRSHGRFPTPDEDVRALGLETGRWELLVSEIRERQATGPDGRTGTMKDSVVVVQRVG